MKHLRYFYHPESDSLWSEELTEEQTRARIGDALLGGSEIFELEFDDYLSRKVAQEEYSAD